MPPRRPSPSFLSALIVAAAAAATTVFLRDRGLQL